MELTRSINVSVGEEAFTLNFPNIGQIMDIESRRMSLSGGQYGNLVKASTFTANLTLDMIDTVSFFSVLKPTLFQQDEIDISKWDYERLLPLIKAYKKTVMPWYNKWMEKLSDTDA